MNTPENPSEWAEQRINRTATSLGKCDACDLRGMEGAAYCRCEYGRQRQLSHMRRIESRYDHAGVSDRLKGCTMQSLRHLSEVSYNSEAAAQVRDQAGESPPARGLCILGSNGLGKSGLLTILARQAYKRGQVPLWIKYADLVRDGVQAGYGDYTSEGVELSKIRLQAAQRAHVLCLDDLGDPFGKADAETTDRRDILFRILSARHERQRLTHITANFRTLKEIGRFFDPRTADRIREMCDIVQMDGPNLRA